MLKNVSFFFLVLGCLLSSSDLKSVIIRSPIAFRQRRVIIRNPFKEHAKGITLTLFNPFGYFFKKFSIIKPSKDSKASSNSASGQSKKFLYLFLFFIGFIFSYQDEKAYKKDLAEF